MFALVLAIVGTVGVGGFIALAVFAPPIAAAVAKGTLDVVSRLWATRAGMALLVGAAVGVGAYMLGTYAERAHCDTRVATLNNDWTQREADAATAYEESRVKRDADVAAATRASTDQQIAEIQTRANELQTQVDEYAAERAKTPEAVCRLTDSAIDRINRIGRMLPNKK
jgi:trans-2-enoyl-CoA reductase